MLGNPLRVTVVSPRKRAASVASKDVFGIASINAEHHEKPLRLALVPSEKAAHYRRTPKPAGYSSAIVLAIPFWSQAVLRRFLRNVQGTGNAPRAEPRSRGNGSRVRSPHPFRLGINPETDPADE